MALTKDRNTPERAGGLLVLPVKGGVKIFAGSLVAVENGFAIPGKTAISLKAAGRAEEYMDNSGGADGAATIKVARGVFRFKNSVTDPIAAADVLGDCYIEDDETVAKTDGAGTRSKAGKILAVEPEGIWVEVR
ncbi:MAG: hypothetical protein PWQ97_453 [Tepidanaerobacteraceae bacterium]|nr:hypothetical protein [Tepidanaerobacteraceae bacterium]